MSLPFFDKKKTVSMIIEKRGKLPLEAADETEAGEGMDPSLKEACEDILRAIESKSALDLGKALMAAMDVVAGQPEA